MPHPLFTKRGLDEVNKQLLDPSQYPGADPDYQSPFWFKGTEPEEIRTSSTPPRSRGVRRRAAAPASPRDLRKMVQQLEHIRKELERHPEQAQMFNCDWRVIADVINYFRQAKAAGVDFHEEPRHLPPRPELRSHLDEDVRDEVHEGIHDDEEPHPLFRPGK